jgi:hypothetical protein
MIRSCDLNLIGVAAQPGGRERKANPFVAAYSLSPPLADGGCEPWMTYVVDQDGPVWRIVFHGAKAGRFRTFDEALGYARNLAKECAALGKAACVIFTDRTGGATREQFAPHGAPFGGFLAPHQA